MTGNPAPVLIDHATFLNLVLVPATNYLDPTELIDIHP